MISELLVSGPIAVEGWSGEGMASVTDSCLMRTTPAIVEGGVLLHDIHLLAEPLARVRRSLALALGLACIYSDPRALGHIRIEVENVSLALLPARIEHARAPVGNAGNDDVSDKHLNAHTRVGE